MRAPLRPRDLCALVLVATFGVAATGTHVVGTGETLSEVAADHGTTVAALVEANGLTDPDLIRVGQRLTIPGTADSGTPASPTSTAAPTVTHVVANGETLGTIAARYGASISAIAEANGITDPNRIRAGTSLTIDGAAAAANTGDSPTTSESQGLVGQRHTVRIGETIAGIAGRYGLRAQDLIAWNGLVDGRIYATTRLVLYNPGSLPVPVPSETTTSYVVRNGDALSVIAARHQVSLRALLDANELTNPDRISVGQELTIPGGTTSGFVCPVEGGSFFNDWAFPRSGGRSHAGNDIFAPRGTPVHAPAAGLVEIATGTIGGKQFRLTSADDTEWFGSHMDRFGATGQVSAGTVIGYVGDTGNALGSRPHLHFEVHPGGGDAVNPYPLLRSLC